jgi:Arm DNA-binding domain
MKRKLTDLAVARIKPPATGRLEVWDTAVPGFGCRVTSNGARSFVVALRRPGTNHPARFKLDGKTVKEARKEAGEALGDPAAFFAKRESPEPAKVDTVAAVVAEHIERHQKPNNRAWREVQRVLERELAPWGDRPIQSITRRDVIELLDGITDRGSPYMANRTLAHVRKLFAWAMDRDIVTASPVAGVKAPASEASRDRVFGALRACRRLAGLRCARVALRLASAVAHRHRAAGKRGCQDALGASRP